MNIRKEFKFYKMAIVLALPVMFQQLISALGQLIDNLMVGQLNESAISAVGVVTNGVFIIVMCIGFGIGEGVSIFIAQEYGAKKYEDMKHSFATSIVATLGASIIISIILLSFPSQILGLFHLEGESLELGISYLRIVVPAFVMMLFSQAIGATLRATSRTKIPMYAGVVAIVINTGLNFLLINGNLGFPALGVNGAAIATVIARTIEVILLILIMLKIKPEFLPSFKDFFTIPLNLFKAISKKTIPLIFNEALWGAGKSALIAFYGTRGIEALAGITIANTIANLLFVTMSGFAVATSILVGQKLGRNRLNQAKRDSHRLLRLGILVGIVIALIAAILAQFVPYLYDVSENTRTIATQVLTITGLAFPIYLVTASMFFILRAGGDALGVLIMDSGAMWVVTVPVAYISAEYTTLSVVMLYVVIQFTEVIKMLIGWWRYSKYNWIINLNKKIKH